MTIFKQRRDRLRELMAQHRCLALLITDLSDVRYFCGFSGSNGALIVTEDVAMLATDFRYATQAGREAPGVELIITRNLIVDLLGAVREMRISHVGFDGSTLSVSAWRRAGDDVPGVELMPVKVNASALRQVKDEVELAAVAEACAISTRALARLVDDLRVGMSEIEVARRLELLMGLEGAPDRSFDSIVATGPHSAIPHHQPTMREIAAGDLLKIDFGALFDGYHADCTRTFIVAAEPAPWQVEIHDVVARAQQAGIDALAVGVAASHVDAAARKVIEDAGYGEFFGHGLGHGVGLEIHEVPFIGPTAANTVEAGVPLTVEPGIYLPERGGVRIEDTMVVLDTGVRILTDFPRELTRVG
jgi:Xaa-Pro aminopeptidase